MYIKAILLTLIFVGLSACGHLNKSAPDPGNPNLENPDLGISSEQKTENTQTKPNDATEEKNESENLVVDEVDLLDRIRSGFEFPELSSSHIHNYEKWNSQHPTYLADLFTRAEPFLYYILEEIEKRDLPTELALLPAIESAYKPQATSRSGAAGLWQFIRSTGKSYGLDQDWWYDGRRDALSATSAALDYLTLLNNKFNGDWFLTLAAYNAGPGTVQRAIKSNKRKGKATNYKSLKLRSETKRYVPKLIALKNIINNPERFGVTLRSMPNQPYFEVVELNRQIDLQAFAKKAGINPELFQHLNASYLRWVSPPQGPHRLLMPLWNQPQTSMAVQSLSQTQQIQYQRHSILQGESLSTIARRYGVSINALRSTNNISGSSIRAGKTLMIPIAQRDVKSDIKPIATTQNEPSKKLVHRVVKGDTLWSISRRYQVQIEQLIAWNELAVNSILTLNQALLVFKN